MSKKKTTNKELFEYKELLVVADIPAPLAQDLGEAGAALSKVSDPALIKAFWIPAETMHLTLLHLGSVREDLVETLAGRFEELAGDIVPFRSEIGSLRLTGPEAEDGEDVPDALWAVPGDEGPIQDLHAKLKEAVNDMELGAFIPEPYRPHIPVGLFTEFRNTREFGSVLVEHEERDFGPIPVNEIILLENRAAKGKKRQPFRPIARFELKGKVEE